MHFYVSGLCTFDTPKEMRRYHPSHLITIAPSSISKLLCRLELLFFNYHYFFHTVLLRLHFISNN